MNFSQVATDIGAQMMEVVNYILSLNITPAEKRARLAKAFSIVGQEFYFKMFADNSELFDSTAISTLGFTNPDSQIQRLATKIVQNDNLGRKNDAIVKEFFDSVLGDAQYEAFENGISLGKVPTLTRRIVGETCTWCISRSGTFVYPDSELFARHDNCDCLFIVDGYNSRNGILTNYRKVEE